MRMHFNKDIKIGPFRIKEDSKAFIIAEAGVNHGGNMRIAEQMIDVAAEAGADAVKFQTFKTECLILRGVKKTAYQLKTTQSRESQFEMLRNLEMTPRQQARIKSHCQRRKIIFLSTPFDEYSLGFLDRLGLPAYKISSTDLTNLPFLRKVAKKRKPMILSTGMSYLKEIKSALAEIHPFNKDVILLQCTANYPIDDDEANLNVINTFRDCFDMLLGFSDHSRGIGAAPYAVALGAKVLEKHFTLDRSLKGPDQRASLSPQELKHCIQAVRKAERYLGDSIKLPTLSERKNRLLLQKCLVASRDIKKGELLTGSNVVAKRTGGIGISPIAYKRVFGRRAAKDYAQDEVILL